MNNPRLAIVRPALRAAAVLALTTGTTAQGDTSAGYGRHFIPTFDNEVGANGIMLGVQELGGRLYCTGRGNGPSSNPPHTVVVRDLTGRKLREFSQGGHTSSSAWGWRDGATDGRSLLFGSEAGVHVIDTAGNLVSTVIAKAGPQAIVNPIKSKGITATHRGLAYDPAGNGGKGSILVGDFGAPIEEIALDGTVLRTLPSTLNSGADAWSVYGLALDDSGPQKTFWANSAPNQGDLVEYDWATGKATGNRITGVLEGSQGGLSGFRGVDANGEQVHFGLIAMDQATPDSITGYRIDTFPGIPGEKEPRLLSSVGTGPLDATSPKRFVAGQPGAFAWDSTPSPAVPCLYLMDAGQTIANISLGGLLPELRRPGLIQAAAVVSTTPIRFTSPVGMPIGLKIALQALSLDNRANATIAGVVASNQVMWQVAPQTSGVVVRAQGADSFNAITTSGFFQVRNTGAETIEEVTFDWTGVAGQSTMVFDTDQLLGNRDFRMGGRSVCTGSYVNSSDAACGLVYDAANTYKDICFLIFPSNSGFIAGGGVGFSHKSLTFRFTNFGPGKTLEFDCDTDGGLGIAGGAMQGMKIRIKLRGGKVLNGALAHVNPLLSEATL